MSFTIYQASAGSGKTFSLAKEYLKIALSNPEAYKNILAITFTNKAAAEMKDRILSYLEDIDSGDVNSKGYTEMLPAVLKEVGFSERKAVENASVLLKNIIYNYNDFSIMTIDAFFQRVLRTFAYDLDIPSNFQLEIDSREIIEQVVELLIDQVGDNEELTKMMIGFINSSADGSKSWHIENDILSFTPELFKEQSKTFVDAFKNLTLADFAKIIKNFADEKALLIKRVNVTVDSIESMLGQVNVPMDAFINGFLSKWIKSLREESFAVKDGLRKALNNNVWFSKPNALKYGSQLMAVESDFVLLLYQTIADSQRILFINAIQKKIFPMALINELRGMFDQVETMEHSFQISNTNFKLNEVTSQEPAPFIYERLGDKYYYYFIDEFQDTSRLQWLNILPLICEALSAYHGVEQGKAILFGDPKQAIYRFRGGDMDLFVELPKISNPDANPLIEQMESTIEHQFNPIHLDTNFRSYQRVVEFNNQFFSHLINGYPQISPYYTNHIQEFLPSKQGGWVTVDEADKKVDYPEFVKVQTKKYIEDAIACGFEYKDIAILFRDKKNAIDIASFLSKQGIPVISSESLLLVSSLKVLFVFSLLKCHVQKNDPVLLFSTLLKFYQLTNEAVDVSSCPISSSLDLERVFNQHHINFKFQDLQSLSLYEKAELVVRLFNLEKSADVYMLMLLNLLQEKGQVFHKEEQFWEWWDKNQDKISVEMPESVNGITLITIHKSKGLEYPVVICPNYKFYGKDNEIWVSLSPQSSDSDGLLMATKIPIKMDDDSDYLKDVETEKKRILIDQVNVLYVALTRAVERLHVIIDSPPVSGKTFSVAKEISAFVNDSLLFEKSEIEDGIVYAYGESHVRKCTSKSVLSNGSPLKTLKSVDWKNNQWLSADKANTSAIAFGNLFHFVMSRIQSSDDVEMAMELLKRTYSPDEKQLGTVREMIDRVINHSSLTQYFSADAIINNEVEVVDQDGELYRPDRVVELDGQIAILDFKTGIPSPHHINQVDTYKSLYRQMGKLDVHGVLVYVDENQVTVEMI